MGHSSNFARWPHLGPIPPMDGGGHLGPLSYVYGYRGGIGRRGVGQGTAGDDGIEIPTGTGSAISAHSMALRSGFRAEIGHFRDGPMWVNGKTADLAKKISPLFGAPGRPQVAYQVAGANSGPLNSCCYSLVGLGGC